MRKFLKNKLISSLNSLKNYDLVVEQYANNKETANLQQMLTELQKVVIKVGEIIENQSENSEKVIAQIEEYCEMLWRISVCEEDEKISVLLEKMKEQRNIVVNKIETEVPVRYEVVFLPYKSNLWDAFDSVWRAAKLRDDVDVYVTPIPYYEKNERGELDVMHYEKDGYPEDIEIYDYKNYNIAERNPDVIFIHNPYDEYNSTTSVDPKFYACELRNYTNMLIYIPYFVSVDNKISTDLCALPGCFYSNKVIVESEVVRETYIKCLHDFEVEKNCVGLMGNIEDKIVALGSPKYDWIYSNLDNTSDMPQEWKNILNKKDTDNRKIVLYNTSIKAMLMFGKNMLAKIRETIDTVQKDDNTVLLWRPHPLMKSMIKANMPELYEEYCYIVKDFIENSKGIYDDTSDLSRAIAISDMYYGDNSSVVELYKKTKKPVLVQKCNSASNDRIHLNVGAGVVYKDKLYFSDLYLDGLFEADLINGSIRYVKGLSAKETRCKLAYRDAYIYGNEAWFTPWKEERILKINLDTFEITSYDIPYRCKAKAEKNILHKAYARTGIYKDRYIYMVPSGYDAVVFVDMKESHIYPIYDVVDVENESCIYGTVESDELKIFFDGTDIVKKIPISLENIIENKVNLDDVKNCEIENEIIQNRNIEVVRWNGMKLCVSTVGKDVICINEDNEKSSGRVWGLYSAEKPGFRIITNQGKMIIKNTKDIFVENLDEVVFKQMSLEIKKDKLIQEMKQDGLTIMDVYNRFMGLNGVVSEKYVSFEEYIKGEKRVVNYEDCDINYGIKIWKMVEELCMKK